MTKTKLPRVEPPEKVIDLRGRRFGDLVVREYVGRRSLPGGQQATVWRCGCLRCGREAEFFGHNVKSGRSTQCRWCSAKAAGQKNRTHGYSGTPTYAAWIAVTRTGCVRRWAKFGLFLRDMGVKPPGTMLARRDRARPHGPRNSYWRSVRRRRKKKGR